METKKRIEWLDIAKGIAIICTIIGHSVSNQSVLFAFIFSFHMPLFFILSGYTIKKNPFSQLKTATFRDFKRLIIPIFVVFLIDFVLHIFFSEKGIPVILNRYKAAILWGTYNHGMGMIWFLVALFYAKFLFRIVLNTIPKYREIFLLFGTFLFGIQGLKIELPQNLDLMFIAMLFMDAGYLLKNSIDEESSTVEKAGIAAFFIWIYLVWNKNIFTDMAQRKYPILAILAAICASLCIIQLCKVIEHNHALTKTLGFFGKESLTLLCIHQFDGYWIQYLSTFRFSEGSKFECMNSFIYCFIRILIDTMILLAWVIGKNLLLKLKAKISNKTTENERIES